MIKCTHALHLSLSMSFVPVNSRITVTTKMITRDADAIAAAAFNK